VSVVDDDGVLYSNVALLDLSVLNAAPLVDAGIDQWVSEGEEVLLTGDFTDPGGQDTHTFLWQVTADNGQVILDGTTQNFSFTPADEGSYTATFTVTDNDGGVGTDTVVVTALDVAPTIELIGVAMAVEAEPYTLTLGPITDPGDDTVTQYRVHWGDGETDIHDSGGDVSHVFTVPGVTHTVTVDLVDEDGTYENTGSMEILVVSATPEIIYLGLDRAEINEDGTVLLTGQFEQLGVQVVHTVDIAWGDGETSTLVLGPDEFGFEAEHQYLDDDPSGTLSDDYEVVVTVADNDGDSDTGSLPLTVLNVAPALEDVKATDVLENGLTVLTGSIADPGTLDSFTLMVDWGDGTSLETFDYAAGTTAFTEAHQYLDDDPSGTTADNYTIGLTLADDDKGSYSGSTTVTVTNLAPVITELASSAPRVGDAGPGDVVSVSMWARSTRTAPSSTGATVPPAAR